jgi:hypothetical protein
MKELTRQQVFEVLKSALQDFHLEEDDIDGISDDDMAIANACYRLGQHEAQPSEPDRWKIASQQMAGLLANPEAIASPDRIAKDAIAYTDALIAELNRTAEKGGEG